MTATERAAQLLRDCRNDWTQGATQRTPDSRADAGLRARAAQSAQAVNHR